MELFGFPRGNRREFSSTINYFTMDIAFIVGEADFPGLVSEDDR